MLARVPFHVAGLVERAHTRAHEVCRPIWVDCKLKATRQLLGLFKMMAWSVTAIWTTVQLAGDNCCKGP